MEETCADRGPVPRSGSSRMKIGNPLRTPGVRAKSRMPSI